MAHEETHKGYTIVIEDDETTADGQPVVSLVAGVDTPLKKLKIDNKRIDAIEEEPGSYSTSYLPYTAFDSIISLAKAVIEDTPEFNTWPR
jgi:SOS-response transcriptional repressor LexA